MYLIKITEEIYIHRDRINYIELFNGSGLFQIMVEVSFKDSPFYLSFSSEEERRDRFLQIIEDCQRLGVHK
jgi:hypothetical protein